MQLAKKSLVSSKSDLAKLNKKFSITNQWIGYDHHPLVDFIDRQITTHSTLVDQFSDYNRFAQKPNVFWIDDLWNYLNKSSQHTWNCINNVWKQTHSTHEKATALFKKAQDLSVKINHQNALKETTIITNRRKTHRIPFFRSPSLDPSQPSKVLSMPKLEPPQKPKTALQASFELFTYTQNRFKEVRAFTAEYQQFLKDIKYKSPYYFGKLKFHDKLFINAELYGSASQALLKKYFHRWSQKLMILGGILVSVAGVSSIFKIFTSPNHQPSDQSNFLTDLSSDEQKLQVELILSQLINTHQLIHTEDQAIFDPLTTLAVFFNDNVFSKSTDHQPYSIAQVCAPMNLDLVDSEITQCQSL